MFYYLIYFVHFQDVVSHRKKKINRKLVIQTEAILLWPLCECKNCDLGGGTEGCCVVQQNGQKVTLPQKYYCINIK